MPRAGAASLQLAPGQVEDPVISVAGRRRHPFRNG